MAENLLKLKISIDGKDAEVGIKSIGAQAAALAIGFNQITQAIKTVANTVESAFRPLAAAQTDMANIATLGVDNLGALNQSIQAVAQTTSKPIADLRGGLYNIISAGVGASDQIKVLEASALSAKAGLAQTTDSLNLGSAVIKGYGKDWSEFESVMDMAFQTVKLGQTTFPELASSIGMVTPMASALKIKSQELFGVFAAGTGVTGKASEVATQFRGILSGLAQPTSEMTELMQKYGYETVEAAVQNEGLAGILKILGKETGGSAAEMGKLFGSVEATNLALALSTTQYNTFIEKTGAMTDSTGAMREAADKFTGTLNDQIDILKNRWTVVAERAATAVLPLINGLLDMAVKATDARSNVDKLSGALENVQKKLKQTDEATQLIVKYEELSRKAKLTSDEQETLRDVTDKLAKIFPSAVTAVDSYGKALSINSGYVRMMIDAQKKLLQLDKDGIFKGAKKDLAEFVKTIATGNERLTGFNQKLIQAKEKGEQAVVSPTTGIATLTQNVKAATMAYEAFKGRLDAAYQSLPETLALLANFVDLHNPDALAAFGAGLGLNADEMAALNVQVEQYLKQFEAAKAAGVPTPTPTDTTRTETTVQQTEVRGPFVTPFSQALGEPGDLQQTADIEQEIVENLYLANQISAEEYYTMRMSMAEDAYQNALLLGEDENLAYSRHLAQKTALNQAYAQTKQALELKSLSSGLNSMFVIFGQHKAAMYGQAIINTAEAVTEALPNVWAAAAAGLAGAAQIATIARTNIQPRALGGDVESGAPYIVGERGPELFVPDEAGYILPGRGAASGPGGGAVAIDYDLLAKKVGDKMSEAVKSLVIQADLVDGLRTHYPHYDKEIKRMILT